MDFLLGIAGVTVSLLFIWLLQDRLPLVKQESRRVMDKYRCRIAGSYISEGPFSISFNYRNSDPDWAQTQSEFLISELRRVLNESIVKVCAPCAL